MKTQGDSLLFFESINTKSLKSKLKEFLHTNKILIFIYSNIYEFLALTRFKTTKLILVYDAEKLKDGLGAQIQRILSVKALSEYLGSSFENFEIVDYDTQIFNHENFIEKKLVINKWKGLLKVDCVKYKRRSITININPKRIIILYIFRFFAKIFFTPIRIKIAFPGILIDKNPIIYKNCGKYLNSMSLNKRNSDYLKIVVHIRRGEALLSQFRDRYLPYGYYENILKSLISELDQLNLKYEIVLLSEKITNPILDQNDPKVINSIKSDKNNSFLSRLSDGNYFLSDEPIESSKFPILSTCELKKNNDPFSDFKLMCESDILIISKSSFGFTAGILNSQALKIYKPFWHNPSDDWITDLEFLNNSKKIVNEWLASYFKSNGPELS